MKKKNIAHICTCSAILALLFGAGALSLHTNAALRGDINEDGKINANDYIALRRALLAGESLPSKTADVNGDGKINAADYIALRMHLLGLRPITQPEERFVRTLISLGCKYTVSGTIGYNLGNIGYDVVETHIILLNLLRDEASVWLGLESTLKCNM